VWWTSSRSTQSPRGIAERVRLCLASIPAERLSLVPDCGFFPVPRWVAAEKLKRLAAGAALARKQLAG
jgi:5-methyltetrahydropteroyltriglutamate--homocysteine methyltransferase